MSTSGQTDIADHIENLKSELIERWREQVSIDPEQAAIVKSLDDQELKDHLPALAENIIRLLRGQAVYELEQAAARHGEQRRKDGYSVIALLREFEIFRIVLLDMVQEIVRDGLDTDEIERARRSIIATVDRSMNLSVLQYTLAAEEERNSARGEARELHEQRDRFLVTLSHELRNQVSPILLAAQLLQDLNPTDRRILNAVGMIERQARHQAILIEDLLEISRFRFGKIQLKPETLDLREIVRHSVETLQSDFTSKRLHFEIQLPEQPVCVSADFTRMAQVVINLLGNAVKFTQPGGAIYLTIDVQADTAVMSLRDTGIGFRPDLSSRLFTMFFQSGESQEPRTGLGVGLALGKILVEMHGGTIEAQSQGQGEGATFTVRLPMVPNPTATNARLVLIVDDNPDHRVLLAQLLKVRGYQVIEAQDGSEALRLIGEHRPSACVIDIGLPDMDGYQLARRMRESATTRNARLIALTGYSTKDNKELFEQAGFDHVFPKPPNLDKLSGVLAD